MLLTGLTHFPAFVDSAKVFGGEGSGCPSSQPSIASTPQARALQVQWYAYALYAAPAWFILAFGRCALGRARRGQLCLLTCYFLLNSVCSIIRVSTFSFAHIRLNFITSKSTQRESNFTDGTYNLNATAIYSSYESYAQTQIISASSFIAATAAEDAKLPPILWIICPQHINDTAIVHWQEAFSRATRVTKWASNNVDGAGPVWALYLGELLCSLLEVVLTGSLVFCHSEQFAQDNRMRFGRVVTYGSRPKAGRNNYKVYASLDITESEEPQPQVQTPNIERNAKLELSSPEKRIMQDRTLGL